MGIDINGLVNFGKQLAKNDGGVNQNVIEGDARNVFNAEVEKTAQSQGVDASEIYANMDIASLMGAELGKTTAPKKQEAAQAPVFSDDEITFDKLFALVDDVAPVVDEQGKEIGQRSLDREELSTQGQISDMTYNAGIPHAMAVELAKDELDTHKVVETMAYMTENVIPNGVVDNAQYEGESNIANLISYLVADGYLS